MSIPNMARDGEHALSTRLGEADVHEDEDERSDGSFELLRVLWRRRLLVVLVLVLCVLTSILFSLRQTKEFEASASVLFRDPGFARTLYGSDLFDAGQDPERAAQTNIDVVHSANVARVARERLKSSESVDSLLASVEVEPSSDSDVADIKARRASPEDAMRVADAFAYGYIFYRQSTDRQAVQRAKDLIHQALDVAENDSRAGLLASLRQLEVLRTLQTGNAEVIAPARASDGPVAPRPTRNALFGFVLGVLAGCAVALMVDFLDRRLQREEDVERAYSEFPLLTTVPDEKAANQLLEADGRTGEAYRMLREGLRFVDPERTVRCVVITSADEGEGKSTVARHLAVVLASSGQTVILVEADMRRPTAAEALGVPPRSSGLSNALASMASASDLLICPEGFDNSLFVLPAGPVPPRPADLLRTARAGTVLAELRGQADVVIVDAPPLLPVSDTRALLQLPEVDGVIMVGRVRVTRRDRAREARRVLTQTGRRVVGLVITGGTDNTRSSYYQESDTSSRPTLAGKA